MLGKRLEQAQVGSGFERVCSVQKWEQAARTPVLRAGPSCAWRFGREVTRLTRLAWAAIMSGTKNHPNMKRLLFSNSFAIVLLSSAALAADDLGSLAGKWSVKKLNDQGQNYTQTIEVKKDKFVFQILGADDNVVLYAEGDLKLDKVGPFSSAKFYHIRSGRSASDLQDVDDEYVSIYTLDNDTWTLAANFDKQRERQKPSLDLYKRVKAPPSPTKTGQ